MAQYGGYLASACLVAVATGLPVATLGQGSQVVSASAAWTSYRETGARLTCGVHGSAGGGTISMEIASDHPATMRLRFEKSGWRLPSVSELPVEATFTGLKSGAGKLSFSAAVDGKAIQADLQAENVRTWVHGFTGGSGGLVGFPDLPEPPWLLDLSGTSAAVDEMQLCIVEMKIANVPPPFSTTPKSATVNVTASQSSATVGGSAALPSGYAVVQIVRVGSGEAAETLQVLADRRLTPAARAKMWGASRDPGFALGEDDPVTRSIGRDGPRPGKLRLLTSTGQVIGETTAEAPLARIEPAPLHGLPSPTFEYTVDLSLGMGSYSGPATELLQPLLSGLRPLEAVDPNGKARPIVLAQTGKAGWLIVSPRRGVTEEIESVSSGADFDNPKSTFENPQFETVYRTYRFNDGRWRVAERGSREMWNGEVFPNRRQFP